MSTSAFPRGLLGFAFAMILAAIGLIIRYEVEEADRVARSELFRTRIDQVPNAKHVWWSNDIFFRANIDVLGIGEDFIALEGNWTELCRLDSNHDGVTNG